MYNKMTDQKWYTELSFFKVWLLVVVLGLLAGTGLQLLGYWPNALPTIATLLALATTLLLLRMAQLIFDRNRRHDYDYQQTEALFSLYHHLQPGSILPMTRKHAGSPDFLNLIMEQLIALQPQVVVEASSGISSIVVAEYLRQHLPESRHFALEHEAKYAALTRQKINFENSSILHAPLQEYQVDGKKQQWYSVDGLRELSQIDLLIVDGPPRFIHEMARYPAVPVLSAELQLLPKVIILDDTIRPAEHQAAKLWASNYGYELQSYPLEKGAIVLRKKD
jgi:hypothetical protein